MTGLPVEQRFENHKKGQKSAWVVRKYGLRLSQQEGSLYLAGELGLALQALSRQEMRRLFKRPAGHGRV